MIAAYVLDGTIQFPLSARKYVNTCQFCVLKVAAGVARGCLIRIFPPIGGSGRADILLTIVLTGARPPSVSNCRDGIAHRSHHPARLLALRETAALCQRGVEEPSGVRRLGLNRDIRWLSPTSVSDKLFS